MMNAYGQVLKGKLVLNKVFGLTVLPVGTFPIPMGRSLITLDLTLLPDTELHSKSIPTLADRSNVLSSVSRACL